MESDYLLKESLEALKLHLNEYLNTVWKTFAALIVANGWFLSSESTRELICQKVSLQVIFSVITLFMAIAHLATLVDLYKKSKLLQSKIDSSAESLLNALKKTYSIPLSYPVASFFINALLYSSLITLFWCC